MKKIFLFLFLLFFFCVPLAFAQDSGWVINTFHSDIAIQKSGVVTVSETIAVDFRQYQKHGIYRDIPYVYDQKNGQQYYTEISVEKVTQDSAPATYKVFTNGDYQRIQIGESDTTISGKHTYVITYIAKGILKNFGTYDELYWNVTGDQWGVFIESASATVTVPSNVAIQDHISCYQGESGSTTPCSGQKTDAHTASFTTTGLLGSQEGMTIAIPYTPKVIPILTVARPKTFIEKALEPLPLLVFIFVAGIGSLWVVRKWWQNGRDPNMGHETIVVEYTAPEKLRPAEIGVLMDEKADTLDITATIIDLTARGFLTITETPKKWVFGTTNYILKRTNKNADGLLGYEQMLLDDLFDTGDEVKVSDLKNTFYKDLKEVKTEVYNEVVRKGLFATNPQSVRNTYLGFGIGGIVIASIILSVSISTEFVIPFMFSIGLMVVSGVMVVFSRFMGRRTEKGRELYRRIKGYKLFINTAERYQQRFFEQKNLFSEVLPYVIVFGLTQKFAQAMKDIGLNDPQMTGYYGIHAFNAFTFTNTVNDFSNSFSSAAASMPSSSGSGGGGSSGGGFGGGGGGSW